MFNAAMGILSIDGHADITSVAVKKILANTYSVSIVPQMESATSSHAAYFAFRAMVDGFFRIVIP
jgi:hypothetical protein